MKFAKLMLPLCFAAVSAVSAFSPVQARELKFAVGLPPSSVGHYGMEFFVKTLKEKSGGDLDAKIFPMSLLNLSQMHAGIRDGANRRVTRFRQLLEKWDRLTPANVNWEINPLGEIYNREIFSKIDPKSYGL